MSEEEEEVERERTEKSDGVASTGGDDKNLTRRSRDFIGDYHLLRHRSQWKQTLSFCEEFLINISFLEVI